MNAHSKSTYQIEKGVPLPDKLTGTNACKYPWARMEVGDSFVMDKCRAIAAASASKNGKRRGMKFAVRPIDANTTRIWRIA